MTYQGPILIQDPRTGRRLHAGTVEDREGRPWFTKRVERSKHYFRTLNAWGFDKGAIDSLADGTGIEVIDDEGRVYRTTRRRLLADALVRDFGHGRQYLVPLGTFDLWEDPNARSGEEPEVPAPRLF